MVHPESAKVTSHRREFCHFADALSPSLLNTPYRRERGMQKNDSLADG